MKDGQSNHLLPSIWRGDFTSKRDFDQRMTGGVADIFDSIDDKMLTSRHGFSTKAYCAVCDTTTSMRVAWHFCGTNGNGSVNPAWTETTTCERCSLNSRMRALINFLTRRITSFNHPKVFLAERTTSAYKILKARYKDLTGSKFLGDQFSPGQITPFIHGHALVRHEDITHLSFASRTFDLVVTQDVFEHVPNYPLAFSECAHVLLPGGKLLFTIPFFYTQTTTIIRASVTADGTVEHHHPPEFHGNPVPHQGSLCYQNFGWDILSCLQEAGFVDVFAAMYWGPWQGHLGFPFFVFHAQKRADR